MPRKYIKSKKVCKNPMRFRVFNKPILETTGCVGQCWPGGPEDNVMEVDPRQTQPDYMDTVIHEALHMLFPKVKEPKILRAGTSMAKLLWRLGYRQVRPRKKVVPQTGLEPATN